MDCADYINTLEASNHDPKDERISKFMNMTKSIRKLSERIPAFPFMAVIPQIISRIAHKNSNVEQLLEALIINPQQALWHLIAVSKSRNKERSSKALAIFSKIKTHPQASYGQAPLAIQQMQRLADQLLLLCTHKVARQQNSLSMSRDFRTLLRMTPLDVILPLQSSLTVTLPITSFNYPSHSPFAQNLPTIQGFMEEIDVINSLQRPRKITVVGSDGKEYIFLCKPEDDLRKDSRLMDLNTIINRLFKKDAEARKRGLKVRTYSVIPLNENCGLIEWVPFTTGFRNIIIKAYKALNCYTHVFYITSTLK
jgi:serine/threonine-protein kinase ATR